jgi:hypothetical protein
MPFDGVGFAANNEYLQKIDAVIDLIGSPERWAKGSFRTIDGRHCLRGAIRTLDQSEALGPIILDAINQITWKYYWNIERFNDNVLTDHGAILAVLAKARENIAAGRFVGAPKSRIKSTPLARWWNDMARIARSSTAAVSGFNIR